MNLSDEDKQLLDRALRAKRCEPRQGAQAASNGVRLRIQGPAHRDL